MAKYRMYSKVDKSKETITTIQAIDENDAKNVFSKIKGLDLDKFDSLYSVEPYKVTNETRRD